MCSILILKNLPSSSSLILSFSAVDTNHITTRTSSNNKDILVFLKNLVVSLAKFSPVGIYFFIYSVMHFFCLANFELTSMLSHPFKTTYMGSSILFRKKLWIWYLVLYLCILTFIRLFCIQFSTFYTMQLFCTSNLDIMP